MDIDTYNKLPLGAVLTNPEAVCPACKTVGEVVITIVLERTPNAAVSGHNAILMHKGARWRCGACDASGLAVAHLDSIVPDQ
jgi:hypothetical protein